MKNQIFPRPFFLYQELQTAMYIVLLRMKIRNIINVNHQLNFKQKKETNIEKSILNNVHLIISRIEIVWFMNHDLAPNFWWLKLIPMIIKLNLESTLFYHSVAIYSHQKNILSINFLVILLLKTSFSRNFCQQSVRVNFPQCWKMKNEKIFRQINFFSKNVTFTKFLQNKSVKVNFRTNFHNVVRLLCLMTFIPWNQLHYWWFICSYSVT